MLERLKNEPARVTGFVLAALILAMHFGLPISPEQREAIMVFVTTGLILLGFEFTRSQVSPKKDVP